jgi:hypothetical protein
MFGAWFGWRGALRGWQSAWPTLGVDMADSWAKWASEACGECGCV